MAYDAEPFSNSSLPWHNVTRPAKSVAASHAMPLFPFVFVAKAHASIFFDEAFLSLLYRQFSMELQFNFAQLLAMMPRGSA